MKRRLSFRLLACFACFLSAGAATIDYSAYKAGPEPRSVVLSVRNGMDSRGFAWHTDETMDAGEVRLLKGEFGAEDDARFVREGRLLPGRVFKHAEDGINRHFADVDGLEPGATYSYRLGGAGRWTYGRFKVRQKSRRDVVVVNLNDAQTRDARRFDVFGNACAAAAKAAGGDIDFVLHGGDFYDGRLFFAGSNTVKKMGRFYLQWGMAADTATPYFDGVPWVMVSGNHDADIYAQAVNEAFAVAVEAKNLVGCHSFDCGNVHFATLPWLGKSWGRHYERALEWLDENLEAARKSGKSDWIVVATHAGPYTTGDNMRVRKGCVESAFTSNLVFRLGGICARRHVDLVLQAHDHCYSKTKPYRWDAAGFAEDENDAAAVNLSPRTKIVGGKVCDVNPQGTYYVSCGCAGHRVGEVREYAARKGKMSYANRQLKVVTGRIAVDSRHAKKGDDASVDLKAQMFGILRVDGRRLSYDFYVAEPNEAATLFDFLGIVKE